MSLQRPQSNEPYSGSSPRQMSDSPETVIRAVNGANKNRSRYSSLEELNQTNTAVNGNKNSDTVIIEETDVDMESGADKKSPNGVKNGSSHGDEADSEDMGKGIIIF